MPPELYPQKNPSLSSSLAQAQFLVDLSCTSFRTNMYMETPHIRLCYKF